MFWLSVYVIAEYLTFTVLTDVVPESIRRMLFKHTGILLWKGNDQIREEEEQAEAERLAEKQRQEEEERQEEEYFDAVEFLDDEDEDGYETAEE